MNLFYTSDIQGDLAFLPVEEARHCVQVLRKKLGDQLHFVDGKGGFYTGEIIEAGKKSCGLRIQKQQLAYHKRDFRLHLAIAPTKNIARLEWFLEKATEIGIDEITPILCQRSERKNIRLDRLEKVLVSAMKQSLKAYLPKLNELTNLKVFLEQSRPATTQLFIAHCDYEENSDLHQNYQAGNDVTILIGPEGDFSESEVQLAHAKGFKSVLMGKARLRTETAGLVACHTINFLNELR